MVSDVKEVDMTFKRGQRCTTTFRLTNLMHTMHVAVSLTTTKPYLYSFTHPLSILPPLSTSTFTLHLSKPTDHPPLSSPPDSITVRSSMLPTGKAQQDDLRRLFIKPGPHLFKDATIPISLVGPHVVEFLLSPPPASPISLSSETGSQLSKAISGCNTSQLTSLLRPAVACGNEYFVKALIEAGADVNDRELDRPFVMSVAIRNGKIDIVKVLIASGCSVDDSADRVLHDAAATNRVDLMEVLWVSFENIDVNLVDSEGRTPLHVAAVRGHVESLRFLISIGGNPDVCDCNGWTPLHFAAAEGHIEAVEFLLNCCFYVKYAVTKDGKSAFTLAVDGGHSHLYSSLYLGDVMHRAARVDDINRLKTCIAEGAEVNGRDQNGWTPLHRAAFKGRIECVKLLINNGAQVDLVDESGYTPLHCAVEAGHVQVALYLIAQGARTSVKGLKGVVPFNLDCFKNHPALVLPLCREKEMA